MPQPRTMPSGLVLVLALLASLLMAGCGADAPEPAPRPVLVVMPGAVGAGTVAFAGEVRPREETVLAFRVGGKLASRQVDVGDVVRRGALLAELDPGDLRLQAGSVAAQLAAARAQLQRAEADLARYSSLAGEQLVSESSLDAARTTHAAAAGQVEALEAQLDVARNQASYSQLRAPADGAIAARHVEAGQVVAAGQPVFTLAADEGRDVVISLPEGRIDDVRVGLPVEVALWSAPDRRLSGTVREIAPAADPSTRTWQARIGLQAGAADVSLGQSAEVFLPGEDAGMAVPLAAVQQDEDGGTAVWVVDTQRQEVHLQPVVLGAYGTEQVAVRDGLADDAVVVAAGGHLLREGQRVRAVDRDNRPVGSAPAAADAATAE